MTEGHGNGRPDAHGVPAADAMRHLGGAPRSAGEMVRLRERDGQVWLSIRSEFAIVDLQIQVSASGPRVVLRDAEAGSSIALDPLELEALTRLDHQSFGPLIADR